MVAIWYLLVLAPFIAVPILWWSYRNKVRQQESESGARWERFASSAKADGLDGAAAAPAATPVSAAAIVAAAAATAAPQFTRRARTLDAVQTVVYYLLKTALPDHEVMPQLTLARLLDVPANVVGTERELRVRGLAQHVVDFVVCNKALQVVAAIDLLEQAPPAALMSPTDFKSQCLAQAGIRHLRLIRTALPKRDAVRALVLGA